MSPLRLLLIGILVYFAMRTVRRGKAYFAEKQVGGKRKPKAMPESSEEREERAEREESGEIDGRDPYEVLEIDADASDEEVRTAYQSQMAQYHPDKTSHLAAEIREISEKRTRQVNRAYDLIRKQRGIG